MKELRMTCVVITAILFGLAVFTTVSAQQSQEKAIGSKVRVGTFDSRALAMAYYRSAMLTRDANAQKAQYENAKEAGDEKRVKEMEAEASNPTWPGEGWPPNQAHQEIVHKQGFSTWPVDNILEKIRGKIPEISKQADVEVIVSKWDIVYQRSDIEFVNVTDLMVKPFDPDDDTLRIIKEIQEQDPVPLEELRGHQH